MNIEYRKHNMYVKLRAWNTLLSYTTFFIGHHSYFIVRITLDKVKINEIIVMKQEKI